MSKKYEERNHKLLVRSKCKDYYTLDHYGETKFITSININTLYLALGSNNNQSYLTSHQNVNVTHTTAKKIQKYFTKS
jgi:hypothetical protein